MKLSDWPGFRRLRFDAGLKSFEGLMSLFLSSAERAKASGKKVVAKGPLSPAEPIYAAGALAYDACTHQGVVQAVMKEDLSLTGEAIDAGLGADSNPWILTMLGAIVSGKNDVAIDAYSTDCGGWDDQLKTSWQLMAEATKAPLYFWEVPRFDAESTGWATKYLVRELEQWFDWLAAQTGHEITDHSLAQSIRIGNLLRQDLTQITQMLRLPKVPIPALEYYFVQATVGDCAQDPEMLHGRYTALIQELKERVSKSVAAPGLFERPLRIYFMGEETQQFRVWNAIEEYGGVLVGCDTRLPLYYEPIKEDGRAIEELAGWVWRMFHNLPAVPRLKATIPYIKQQKPDAIIISSVVGSRNTSEAERLTRDIIRDELGLPVLSLETALPARNTEPVDNQIKAFIEATAANYYRRLEQR